MQKIINKFSIFSALLIFTVVTGLSSSAFALNTGGSTGGGQGCGSCGGGSTGGSTGGSNGGGGGTTPVVIIPTATISANPSSIISGAFSNVSWSSTNATSCTLSGGQFGAGLSVGTAGTTVVQPSSTTNYSVVCTNGTRNSNTATTKVTVTVPVANPTANITTNPKTINSGNSSTVSWTSTNATYCKLNGGQFNNITVGTSGSYVVSPTVNTTYTVICYNSTGVSATDSDYVNVNAAVNNPTANITTNPKTINSGNSSTVSWTSTNATYCKLNGGQFNNITVGTSGSYVVSPTVNTNYSINCFNAAGASASDTDYVNVTTVINYVYCNGVQYPAGYVCPVNNIPTVNIYPSTYSVYGASNVILYWSSTNATYCSATPYPFSGSKNTSGSESVYINNTTTYTITCFNSQGQSAQDQTTVSVNQINNDIYCNGIRYPAGSVCPNTNTIAVSTTGANPSQISANIFGYVNVNGGSANTWFEYGTNSYSLVNATNRQYAYSSGQMSANITNLSCNTTYYYRAVASNNTETKYGSTQSFVTSACNNVVNNTNTVITRPATSISQYQAQLNGAFITGSINYNSCSSYFQYGTNYNLNQSATAQNLYNNTTTNYFSQAVYNLNQGTRYYYRAVVNCGGIIEYGNILSFATPNNYVKYTYVKKPITQVIKTPVCNCPADNNTNVPTINAEYMNLIIEKLESNTVAGGTASYRVVYKNISTTTLQNVAIRIMLPTELTVKTADTGDFQIGGSSVVVSISSLRALEEGRVNVVADVSGDAAINKQVVINAYSNYSVPSIIKNGSVYQDEITAYTLSLITDGNKLVNNNPKDTKNSNSLFSNNFFEWLVLIGLVFLFILALSYIFTASKRRTQI